MSAEDNLQPKQFDQPVEESDEFHSKYSKKLKSPWIPEISAGDDKWRSLRAGYSNLQWHLDNHHTKYATKDPTGNSWGTKSEPKGDMTPSQYHDHLHKIQFFKYGQDHKHFTPKEKK